MGRINIWQLPAISFCQRLHLWKTECQFKSLAEAWKDFQITTCKALLQTFLFFQPKKIIFGEILEHLSPVKLHFSCSAAQFAFSPFSSVTVQLLWQALTQNKQTPKLSQDPYPICKHTHCIKKGISLNWFRQNVHADLQYQILSFDQVQKKWRHRNFLVED